MDNVLSFVREVIAELKEELRHEPYQINLLEEVHLHDEGDSIRRTRKQVGENVHTRILKKILMFRVQEEYVLLKKLIEYIGDASKSTSWRTLLSNISDPSFGAEVDCYNSSGRIDLLIEEKGKYALIFENKINEAADQRYQIGRYVKHLIDNGYREEQIYVLYLSAEGKEPNDKSWFVDNLDYQETFGPRYFNLTYKYCILPWLEKHVYVYLIDIKGQDVLKNAVNQYIDYLKGKFSLRSTESARLDKILKKRFLLKGCLNEQMTKLDDGLDELKSLKKAIEGNKEECDFDLLKSVKQIYAGIRALKLNLLKDYIHVGDFPIYDRPYVFERKCHIGVELNKNGRQYILYIGEYTKFFCSIISWPRKGIPIDEQPTRKKLKCYFNTTSEDKSWLANNYSPRDYESAINKMNEVLEYFRKGNE